MKYALITLLFFGLVSSVYSQTYIQKNEELIYSFHTSKGKKMVLVKCKADNSVVYRFGTDKKIELEFKSSKTDASHKMIYSFYLRGGGNSNEGMDLNYVSFTNNNTQYVIYDTYYSEGNNNKIGIKVIDLTSKKTTDIPGNKSTRKGTLINFRDNQLLEIGDEIFD